MYTDLAMMAEVASTCEDCCISRTSASCSGCSTPADLVESSPTVTAEHLRQYVSEQYVSERYVSEPGEVG